MTEPFCYRPEEIARLTDFQILSIKAAQFEKTKVAEVNGEGRAGQPPKSVVGSSRHRDNFIHTATTHLGWTKERAEAAYDKEFHGV